MSQLLRHNDYFRINSMSNITEELNWEKIKILTETVSNSTAISIEGKEQSRQMQEV